MRGLASFILFLSVGYAGTTLGAGLHWQKEVTAKRTFGDYEIVSTAQFYCDNLALEDHKHWRLPTSSELTRIASPKTEPQGFYWSSTALKSRRHEALTVDATTGVTRPESALMLHWVRCVRAD